MQMNKVAKKGKKNSEKRYIKDQCIGEGAFGLVYKGIDEKTGAQVAIKTFKETKDDGVSFGICREIALLRELKHENIVELKDIIIDKKGSLDMVIEYAEYDLLTIIKTHRNKKYNLSEVSIKTILYQILKGIDYLHQNWVIHRDLKPANILVVSEGKVKIADFGLARIFQSPLKPLYENGPVVTIWYRAPEILLGAKHYTCAIDIWAVGCIFAELFLKLPLFPGSEKYQEDQIKKVFEIHGVLNPERWSGCTDLPDYKKIEEKVKEWEKTKPLPRRSEIPNLLNIPKDALDLLLKMLDYNPTTRISARQALSHPYFSSKPEISDRVFDPHTKNIYPERQPVVIKGHMNEKK